MKQCATCGQDYTPSFFGGAYCSKRCRPAKQPSQLTYEQRWELVMKHQSYIQGIVNRFVPEYLGCREDAMQAAMIEAFRVAGLYQQGQRSFISYLELPLSTRMKALYKREHKYRARQGELDHEPTTEAATVDDVPEKVRRAIDRLPAKQKQAIEVMHLGELSSRKAAKVIGVSDHAVLMRARKGCDLLKITLAGVA